MKFHCPVCGYDRLNAPPHDDLICPCCGTHFGYDDYAHSVPELRSDWIKGGAKWFSRRTPMPNGWSPVIQLRNTGYQCTAADLRSIYAQESVVMSGVIVAMTEAGACGIAWGYTSTGAVTQTPFVAPFSVPTGTTRKGQRVNSPGFSFGNEYA